MPLSDACISRTQRYVEFRFVGVVDTTQTENVESYVYAGEATQTSTEWRGTPSDLAEDSVRKTHLMTWKQHAVAFVQIRYTTAAQ